MTHNQPAEEYEARHLPRASMAKFYVGMALAYWLVTMVAFFLQLPHAPEFFNDVYRFLPTSAGVVALALAVTHHATTLFAKRPFRGMLIHNSTSATARRLVILGFVTGATIVASLAVAFFVTNVVIVPVILPLGLNNMLVAILLGIVVIYLSIRAGVHCVDWVCRKIRAKPNRQ